MHLSLLGSVFLPIPIHSGLPRPWGGLALSQASPRATPSLPPLTLILVPHLTRSSQSPQERHEDGEMLVWVTLLGMCSGAWRGSVVVNLGLGGMGVACESQGWATNADLSPVPAPN